LVTSPASKSLIQLCVPAESADVTGPGTASTDRLHATAHSAVLVVPLWVVASTMTVACASAATRRLRMRKRRRVGVDPSALSLTTRPSAAIRPSSPSFDRG